MLCVGQGLLIGLPAFEGGLLGRWIAKKDKLSRQWRMLHLTNGIETNPITSHRILGRCSLSSCQFFTYYCFSH